MIISRVSPLTGKLNVMDIDITEDQLLVYEETQIPVQDIFPHLTPSEREFLISGLTDEDWDDLFPEDPTYEEKSTEYPENHSSSFDEFEDIPF